MDRLADENFMAKALELSHTHLGQTGGNPSVGCVIVKDGEIVGSGVTAKGGRPHAETIALQEAGDAANGATAYVTLEPCSHHGKTPPCADALIDAGITRVVAAIEDPDERVCGKGLSRLRAAGIDVDTGVLSERAEYELAAYLTVRRKSRAHVTLKMAISPDGMIGLPGVGQVFITGSETKTFVHELRSLSDAILVGLGTVVADDPELTCRLPGLAHRSPVRIVLDRSADIPLQSKLVQSAGDVPLIVVARQEADRAKVTALQDAGVEVLFADDYRELLMALATRGISSVLVEGGARVAAALLDEGLVDRIILLTGEKDIGHGGIAAPLTPDHMPAGFRLIRKAEIGNDQLVEFDREG